MISTATKGSEEQAAVKQVMEAKQEATNQTRDKLDRAQDSLKKAANNIDEFDDRLQKAESALMHTRTDADRPRWKPSSRRCARRRPSSTPGSSPRRQRSTRPRAR